MIQSLNILHITDIHIGYNFYYGTKTEELAFKIVDEIIKDKKGIDLVLVSGDIFDGRAYKSDNSNEDELLNLAEKFIFKLLERLNKMTHKIKDLTINDFLILPGNHDLRRNSTDIFSTYKKLLHRLYGNDQANVNKLYNPEYLYSYRIFKDKKIILLGLNSCKVEKEEFDENNIKWLNNVIGLTTKIKNNILETLIEENDKKWYDYGQIDLEQIINSEDELKDILNGTFENYNIIVSFHHHIHLFPELYSKSGDTSLIKNFEQVLQKLQLMNVRLVLHGHKHLPLISPVTNEEYLRNPKSLMYVVAGGSIGSNESQERYFQIVEVYNKEERNKISRIKRYKFKLERPDIAEDIYLPPRELDERVNFQKINKILELERPDLYCRYIDEIEEIDFKSREKRIDRIIESLSEILTSFKLTSTKLRDYPEEILLIILFIHFRINSLIEIQVKSSNKSSILPLIIEFAKNNCELDNTFIDNIFSYLRTPFKENKGIEYDNIHPQTASANQKRIAAYATVTCFFTDLYLMMSQYADFFYKQIEHKINIKIEDGKFHQEIPSNFICFHCEPDRRSVIVQFKSKNPTSHKIAVLFVKEFELALSKYEKDFDELSLKTYYISPKVEKDDNYQLENYNFEAYIPTLLPLLIGENIYKQKEVFIRELVQNSIDAVLLREDLYRNEGRELDFDKTIQIEFGKETPAMQVGRDRKEPVFFIKIKDNGIGMSKNIIERYFIHLGRSYYSSNEFDEMILKKKTTYKPISRFGIGFLTSFLVSREVRIQTKHFASNDDALDIQIPNHEGCFFINKDIRNNDFGTTVTLYEDTQNPIEIHKILKYIKEVLLDIQVPIKISGFDKNGVPIKEHRINSFQLRRNLLKKDSPVFLVPLDNNGVSEVSQKNNDFPFGIYFQFVDNNDSIFEEEKVISLEMNCGIKLNYAPKSEVKKLFNNNAFKVYINYPPNFVNLDVSREKVNSYRMLGGGVSFNTEFFFKQIENKLQSLVISWINEQNIIKVDEKLLLIHRLLRKLNIRNDSVILIKKPIGIDFSFNAVNNLVSFFPSFNFNITDSVNFKNFEFGKIFKIAFSQFDTKRISPIYLKKDILGSFINRITYQIDDNDNFDILSDRILNFYKNEYDLSTQEISLLNTFRFEFFSLDETIRREMARSRKKFIIDEVNIKLPFLDSNEIRLESLSTFIVLYSFNYYIYYSFQKGLYKEVWKLDIIINNFYIQVPEYLNWMYRKMDSMSESLFLNEKKQFKAKYSRKPISIIYKKNDNDS